MDVQKSHQWLQKYYRRMLVVVEGVNVVTKHVKPSQINPDGGRIKAEAPFNASNVAILDPKTKTATRVEYQVIEGKKVRVTKKSQTKLD